MDKNIVLSKVLISDASKLRAAGLMQGTISNIEKDIRGYNNSGMSEALCATEDEEFMALVRLFFFDRKNCRVHLKFNFAKNADLNDRKATIDKILDYCFMKICCHKVTVTCAASDAEMEFLLDSSGFMQEAVLKDELRIDSGFEDAGLYSITSPYYKGYNFAFIPFEKGVAVISGTNDYVDSVRLFHFGMKPDEGLMANVAGGLGLLDADGGFTDEEDAYPVEEDQLEYLPSELKKAAVELIEYFGKSRAVFDIKYMFTHGTDFQKNVWKSLLDISYGTTVCYEDIALSLSAGNKAQARKITRAVGAACSENPIAIFVPCHRVIGKDGSIVGYSAGIDIKDYLLLHEAFSAVTPLIS
ncbi:MAG: methylated-DNA--[protein]-cysteine S-methyltransferase [Saccharofermentans sp.]|nr:methylated-DNA--[protein]-cysteine S-methyltransferase [Saccharofermentans sp.]